MHARENTSTKVNDGEGSEEGEIVDSDEEQNMRQRIKELEARNDELEKIASISGDFTNQYRYSTDFLNKSGTFASKIKQSITNQIDVARIPSDASSISSDEIIPIIKKRTKRKGRHLRRERDHAKKWRSRSNSVHKHNPRLHKSNNKFPKSEEYYRRHNRIGLQKLKPSIENYLETISLDSDEDSDRQRVDVINSDSDYEGMRNSSMHLNRAELRFALARDRTKETKTTGNMLKERLYNGNALLDHKENINASDVVVVGTDFLDTNRNEKKTQVSEQSVENSDKDECATQEEQELRLIALKSAVLKKHLARKKRNAEMAYSPTDFAPVPVNPTIADDNMDVVEEELDDLNDVMEISPINSPKLVLSPCNDDDYDFTQSQSQSEFKIAGDNNSMDMDIAQSGSEEEIDKSKHDQWYPIETAPMTIQSIEINEALKYPLPVHYGIYVPEMQYQLPPPDIINKQLKLMRDEEPLRPPGTDSFIIDEKPPPPPSINFAFSDDDEPPPPPPRTPMSTFSNIFSDMKFDEEPPPPPPFFPDDRNNSEKSDIFPSLETKTEDNSYEILLNQKISSPFNQIQADTGDDENENKDSDEEASALRAVLLSKLQASKRQKMELKSKMGSEQFLSNLEIECSTEEKQNRKGVETVLQKALKRLKSNFSSSSAKENDVEAVEVNENCINAVTLTVENVNSIDETKDTEEHKNVESQSSPHLGKKTDSAKSKLLKKIKNIGAKKISNVSPSITISEEFSDPHHQTKETDLCPQTSQKGIEHHESSNEVLTDLSTNADINNTALDRNGTSTAVEKSGNEIETNSNTVSNENSKDKNEQTTPNDKNATPKDTQEHACKQKSKNAKSPTLKSLTSDENCRTEEATAKRKRLNLPVVQTAATRAQPLSAKDNLISSGVSTLKTAQNFLQTTLNKVRTTTTRTTKIVRPNKVINKEITTNLKRAMTPVGSPTPPAKIQRTTLNTSTKSTNSTLSASDLIPKIKVKKLIISIRASDTESTDDELMREIHERSMEHVKNNNSEIASPLELLMNSASCSPARNKNVLTNDNLCSTKSDTTTNAPTTNAPTTNAAFEKKLDAFLKGIRKNGSLESSTIQSSKTSPKKKNETAKNVNTPSAVRHLPLASQDEYRRLIHRMKLLEKQKQSKKSDEDVTFETSLTANIPVCSNSTQQTEGMDTVAEENTSKNGIKKNIQLKKLVAYENAIQQTSDNIVKLLNKSLSLVADAKNVKIAKLRHEQRLQELRAEMAKLQILYEQEERKFSSMKPHIGASNQFLTSLKKKRRALIENANKLGRSLKGDKYRCNNKEGDEIIAKSRNLHAEIKFVNCLKIDNIDTVLLLHAKSLREKNNANNVSKVQLEPSTVNDNASESNQIASPVTFSENKKDKENAEKKVVDESAKENNVCPAKEIQNTESQNCNDQCDNRAEQLMQITAERNSENQSSNTVENLEKEMRVELEVQQKDDTNEEIDDQQATNNCNSKSEVPIYISPLDHFRLQYRNIDVNAIVCPYEMWGKCADESCDYMHITKGKKQGTELAFTPFENEENH